MMEPIRSEEDDDPSHYTEREVLMNNYQTKKDYGTLLPGIKREVHQSRQEFLPDIENKTYLDDEQS